MNHHFFLLLVVLLCIGIGSSGCSNTAYLSKSELLYTGAQIDWQNSEKLADKNELKANLLSIAQPKPNTKTLGLFKTRLWLHHQTLSAKKGVGKWLQENVGEQAVLLDSNLLERSANKMEQFLFNKGFFYNEVLYQTHTKRQRTKVTYQVNTQTPYAIDSIYFVVDSSRQITKVMGTIKDKSALQSGKQFNSADLQKERNRIATYLRNHGYYDLQSNDIHFDIDSTNNNRTVDVLVTIRPPAKERTHQVHKIHQIFVYPQYYPDKDSTFYSDTTIVNGIHYITPPKQRFKDKAITDFLLLQKGQAYSQKNYDYTLNHLVQLGAFKFANIQFKKANATTSPLFFKVPDSTGTNQNIDSSQLLNCYIFLTPRKRFLVKAEAEINNRSRSTISNALLGTAVSLSNKTILKRAETFSFNVYAGLEFDLSRNPSLINTTDISTEMKLTYPKFLIPFKNNSVKISRYYRPKTSISLSSNYIQRVNFYTFLSNNINFGYDWRSSSKARHVLNPVAISVVNLLNVSDNFQAELDANRLLELSFREQVLLAGNYFFTYSNQNATNDPRFFFFRGGLELSGNLFFLMDKSIQAFSNQAGNLQILGNNYAQYARFDADFRRYNRLGRRRMLVWRLAGGLALPYGNSDVLPYIKQYFSGGNNGLRAYNIRGIGPGSFGAGLDEGQRNQISEFDRTGEIKVEANLEYRFDIWSYFKGAFFLDVGNVWLLKDDPERLGGQFKSENFLQELGIGFGTGLRMDFSYFVIRLDFGIPLRDPSRPPNERWIVTRLSKLQLRHINPNLAIGYPF